LEELGVTTENGNSDITNTRLLAKGMRFAFGVGVTVVCFVYIFKNVDFSELQSALTTFDLRFGALALASLSVGYTLRIYRWAIMLRNGAPHVATYRCARPYLASIALNNILPFRTGDAIRAFVFPRSLGISRSQSLATILFERLLDLLILVALLAFGMGAIGFENAPTWLMTALSLLAGVGVAIGAIAIFGARFIIGMTAWFENHASLSKVPLLRRVAEFTRYVFEYIASLASDARLIGVIALSIAIWFFEAAVFASIMVGLGDPVSVQGTAFVSGLATIATLAPSSPGYFGPFHLAAFESYQLLFGESGRAAAMAVLSHAAIWIPTTIVGIAALGLSSSYRKKGKFVE
jgi:uncharacterized protein (TIRG00374 family)